MFALSFVIVFEFYTELELERVITGQIFGHSLEKLTSINNLTRDQMSFINQKTLLELKDCAIDGSQRKEKKPYHKYFVQN